MKSTASKETLENERRILREAKGKFFNFEVSIPMKRLTVRCPTEKKMLARKEQKDIWDDDDKGDAAVS